MLQIDQIGNGAAFEEGEGHPLSSRSWDLSDLYTQPRGETFHYIKTRLEEQRLDYNWDSSAIITLGIVSF